MFHVLTTLSLLVPDPVFLQLLPHTSETLRHQETLPQLFLGRLSLAPQPEK